MVRNLIIITAMSALIVGLTLVVVSRGETKFTLLHECVPAQSSNFTIWK